MKPFIHDLINVSQLRSGRRASLYRQWQPIISHFGLTAVLTHLARAQAHDQYTRNLENRWAARQAKNWAESDTLRAELTAHGWTMKDGKEDYTLEPNKE